MVPGTPYKSANTDVLKMVAEVRPSYAYMISFVRILDVTLVDRLPMIRFEQSASKEDKGMRPHGSKTHTCTKYNGVCTLIVLSLRYSWCVLLRP